MVEPPGYRCEAHEDDECPVCPCCVAMEVERLRAELERLRGENYSDLLNQMEEAREHLKLAKKVVDALRGYGAFVNTNNECELHGCFQGDFPDGCPACLDEDKEPRRG